MRTFYFIFTVGLLFQIQDVNAGTINHPYSILKDSVVTTTFVIENLGCATDAGEM
jgi:hypothetical protein